MTTRVLRSLCACFATALLAPVANAAPSDDWPLSNWPIQVSPLEPASGEFPESLTQTLVIGGRSVTVRVNPWMDLMPPVDPEPLRVTVELSTQEDRGLPRRLVAEKVLLRRVNPVGPGERRTWNPDLEFIPSTLQIHPLPALFGAFGGPDWSDDGLVDVTVRLRNGGRVVRVNMGRLDIPSAH
jgi:hypothetical protein